jgi:hypothetical protein
VNEHDISGITYAEPGGCECLTCGAIFIGLEVDTKCNVCAGNCVTAAEGYFSRGRDSLEGATCPYPKGSQGANWWTRGFAYTSRLIRAIRAEQERDNLLQKIGSDSF